VAVRTPDDDTYIRLVVAASAPRTYCAEVTSRLVGVAIDARDPVRLATFWAQLLAREVVEDPSGAVVGGDESQLSLRFVRSSSHKTGADQMHVHLTSTSLADQQRVVATALGLGAGHLDVGQRPEEGHVVLADPEGYELCVIEPGNAYLAGCGFLGELACEGSREVGLFWSAVLGWPLVWDQDQETAIQSPRGGTKVAWGGPPLTDQVGPGRQRLVLAPVEGGQETEAERLVDLGATRLRPHADGTLTLADPDGTELWLLAR
jgi:hypothetical protein